MMDFIYSPLDRNELRLLRPLSIQPDSLSFELSTFPRMSTPYYTAVSYTWGDGAPTEYIFINQQRFRVRRNLWSCLYYLGQHNSAAWSHLWVDAICIDQTNVQERNTQVRFMDDIYCNALCVSVWLGLPPLMEEQKNRRIPNRMFSEGGFDWSISAQDMANRPYWSRVWVIQEFLLGRDVILYCGDSFINWDDFNDLLGIQSQGTYLTLDFDYSKHNTGSWAAWPLLVGRHIDRHPKHQQPLYELLVNHYNTQCKDPRDRVFALLGLVTIEERRLLERFVPDYTMSEDDVITFALSHVRHFPEYDGGDDEKLFSGLGVNSKARRKRLAKRAEVYNYLGNVSPQVWFSDDVEEMEEMEDTDGVDGVDGVDGMNETERQESERQWKWSNLFPIQRSRCW